MIHLVLVGSLEGPTVSIWFGLLVWRGRLFHLVWVGCVEGPLIFLVWVDGSSCFLLLVWRGQVFH